MADVQISKIQHRRGKAGSSAIPISAELGWAIDTQKLYIGNDQTRRKNKSWFTY